ncbi:hypothetical protein ACS127_08975 [Amphibacillus sp. Q70]|uniref:hypothetical protein n=1 Tax=Amphibacillus sp. Q70 TaxID=3453416 RepID=UPI003F87E186
MKVIRKVRRKYQPNRWLVGFIGPFILIIPTILFPNLPFLVWALLAIIFCWTNIYFFETTREMLDSGKIKTGFKHQNKST